MQNWRRGISLSLFIQLGHEFSKGTAERYRTSLKLTIGFNLQSVSKKNIKHCRTTPPDTHAQRQRHQDHNIADQQQLIHLVIKT